MQDIKKDPHIHQNWDVTVVIISGAVAPPSTAIVQFCSNDVKRHVDVVNVARKSVHLCLPKTRLLTRM